MAFHSVAYLLMNTSTIRYFVVLGLAVLGLAKINGKHFGYRKHSFVHAMMPIINGIIKAFDLFEASNSV